MLPRSLRPPLATLLIVGGGAVLLLLGLLGGEERPAAIASALATAAAVAGAWLLGVATADDRSAETPRPGPRARGWLTAAFLTSLGVGTLLAAGAPADITLMPAFPVSLGGLIFGVFLAPLLLTGLGFALSFRAPSASDLDRLRRAAREADDEPDDPAR